VVKKREGQKKGTASAKLPIPTGRFLKISNLMRLS